MEETRNGIQLLWLWLLHTAAWSRTARPNKCSIWHDFFCLRLLEEREPLKLKILVSSASSSFLEEKNNSLLQCKILPRSQSRYVRRGPAKTTKAYVKVLFGRCRAKIIYNFKIPPIVLNKIVKNLLSCIDQSRFSVDIALLT